MKKLAVENRDKKLISKRRVAELVFRRTPSTVGCKTVSYQSPKEPSWGRDGIMRNWSLVLGSNRD
jgi:hypothetical protein